MGPEERRSRETVAALNDRGERVGVVQVRLYRPFPAHALVEALPASVRSIAVLDRTKEPGSVGEPLFLDTVAAVTEAFADGEREVMPRIVGGRYGLSSKEFTPGMVAGVFDELKRERPRRRFTIGISDDVSGNEPRLRRDARHRAARHGPRDLLRPRLGRDRRGEQEHDQDPRRRGGTACAGLFRLRLEEVGLADGVAPALRAAADPRALPRQQAGFVGCHQFGLLDRADVLGRAAPGATLLLNCRLPPEAVWDALSRPVQEQILAKHIDCTRSTQAGSRARRASRADQHRPADLLLRALRRAAARAGDRADQGGDRQDVRPARRRGRRTQPGRGRPRARGIAPGRRARAGDRRPRAAAGRSRRRARVRPHGHRGDAGRARRRPAGQRAAGGRHLSERHGGLREAQHLRARRGVGRGPLHPVRQLQLRLPAQRDPLEVLRRVTPRGAPDGFESAPLDAVGLPDTRFTLQVYLEDCTGCALCVEACPVVAPGDPVARRSISSRASRCSRPSGRTSPSSRRCRQTTGRGSTSAPSAAPSSWSRCSSSPARAPGAARRRTSSCSRSSSATG